MDSIVGDLPETGYDNPIEESLDRAIGQLTPAQGELTRACTCHNLRTRQATCLAEGYDVFRGTVWRLAMGLLSSLPRSYDPGLPIVP